MSIARPEVVIPVTVAGALTVAANVVHVPIPYAAELTSVICAVNTAPTGTNGVTVDVLKNDSSVFVAPNTTKPNIAPTTKVSPVVKAAQPVASTAYTIGAGGAAYSPGTNVITPYVNDGAALASLNAGDVLSLSITTVGGTVAGSDLTVSLVLLKK